MKKLLLKSMLLGVMTLVASSAWAESFNFAPTETTIIWASGNSENTENGNQNFYNAEATEWLCTQANISGNKLNNQNAAYGGSYVVIVKFDESTALAGMNIQKATLSFNSVCTVSGKNSNVIVSSIGTEWNAKTVTWDNMDRTATQISKDNGQNVKTSQKTLTEDVTALLSADEDKIVAFAIYTYTAREQKITDIRLVVEAVDASSSAEVTLRYVDGEGNELKTATAVGSAGNTLSLTGEQKADFFVGEKKYMYVSDNSADITVASDGSSVITLTYREAEAWTYTLNAVDGDNSLLKVLVSATAPEGEKINVGYASYINVDGALWGTGKNYSNDGKGFQTSITLSENNITKNLTYSDKGVSNVVYLSEGEDIEGMTVCNSSNSAIRSSNSAAAYAPTDVTFTTLPAGEYEIHLICFDAQKNPNSDWSILAGGEEIAAIHCNAINYYEAAPVEFTLNEESNLTIAKGGGNNIGIDMIYIVKTGDVEVTTKTIGLNPNIWDVEDATERYAAYVWKGEGAAKVEKWIDFAEVDGALAVTIPDYYTGLVLVRLDGATTENNWENKWNQTDDIDFTAIADGTVFTITGWGEGEGAKSTYTTEDVTVDLTALKEKLGKAIEMAKLVDVDTADAEALLVNPDATEEQLTGALQSTVTASIPKAQELIELAKKFFAKFDNTAGEALAPFFAAAEEALAGTDFDAMYNAAMALFAQGLVEGQSALTKVNEYLAKMENETVNNDLAAINTAIAANNLQDLLDALRQMKADLPVAGLTYATQVKALIDKAEGDITDMQNAYDKAKSVLQQYVMGTKDVVDAGFALYELIKAVEAYKEALNAPAYYLVGTMTNWVGDGVKEEYKLTLNEAAEEGAEEYIITLDFEAGAEFKVVKPEGEAYVWYPNGVDNNYVIENAGNYTVYFRPNGDGGSDWFYSVIYVKNNTTTGLRFVSTDTQNAVIYNLAGQKVMKAQKGLYIVNGKKVMMK